MLKQNIFGESPPGEIRGQVSPSPLGRFLPRRAWWQRIVCLGRRPARRLRLCESLALGERRFVAVIEFEQSRFLVGGTSASLVLLARLGADEISPNSLPTAPEDNA
jgi:Flagellar biosynthesis protein, FliO